MFQISDCLKLASMVTLSIVTSYASVAPLPAPPLGYSTWQLYPGTHWGSKQGEYNAVDEASCRAQVDAMVEKGLVKAGYTVFIVDEPCFAGRDAGGSLMANSTTWPSGFKAFASYLEERGMELGIYTDAGPFTCQGCPASAGHEAQDMKTFIEWGATYVKVDRCFGVDSTPMREALPQTFAKYRAAADQYSPDKRVQVSAILAATDNCWEWCNGTCDHCRTTEDIRNSYGAMLGHVDSQEGIPFVENFAGPGYFNDLDMLVVGNMSSTFYNGPSALSPDETKSHIALWAILKSPMLLSCDIRILPDETLALLTNTEMLAIFNDPLAQQAKQVRTSSGAQYPSGLTFETCPAKGEQPLPRQTWAFNTDTGVGGEIVSKAFDFPNRAVTIANCGNDADSRLVLCSTDANKAPQPPGPNCANTTCPLATQFNVSGMTTDSPPSLITSAFDKGCMEGMLGPGRSSVVTNKNCKKGEVTQMWSLHPDGTLRASNNRTDQCLTAERGEPSPASPAGSVVDIFAGALADGSAAVLFFNRGSDAASSGLNLSELPGFDSDVKTATVRDVWAKADLKKATGGQLNSGSLPPHGVAFLRIAKA